MKVVKSYFDEQGHLIIRPYRLKDLAAIYDVSTKTMKKWIDGLKVEVKREKCQYYSIGQVESVAQQLGFPQKINIKKAA
ncbi:hypothetical protein [Flaviaesturariibacter aridisoli]|uniref:Uncharacterized protein n=1 Tax=Flaviaesturariibacter aridisoli TaxID=2545761 RepID=A0A4R4E3H0_9BACT|nr:hypothetical protein [Flaviaesturariibacter aridisoli]TCZ74056.1 hypothetical protein E0486_02990 [Flaviaesturariibacter aridisoli]